MSLRIAVQMDPVEQVNIHGDTTFALMEAAQARGYTLWTYQPHHLSWREGRVMARAQSVTVQRVEGEPAIVGERVELDLATDVDVVLMRQDPPFDMAYLTAAHILELLKGQTLVLNDPEWVRSSPEKLLPLLFPEIIPPTMIARSAEDLKAFRDQYKDIILKPLYGNGGAGVFRLKEGDSNFNALVEMFQERNREPIIAQAFLPAVSAGDKRIILIDGEPVGAINRVPQKGETRSNMHVGGVAEVSDLTPSDKAICAAIGPELKKRGLVLVGIDVIGDKLTEINSTSPTGVQELKRFSGVDTAQIFWDCVNHKL
ncbi:glutathione synthase [Woodsholea maritima]|uniref:glutathione synthase n=1 Tax=Woodsholea maritima TaxID=240237 RepID=UPI00037CB963|nr:glutathione synthase [Woodsholea maritima]